MTARRPEARQAQVLLGLAALIYLPWRYVFLVLDPGAFDPMWMRVVMAMALGLAIIPYSVPRLERIAPHTFHALGILVYVHNWWLASVNDLQTAYLIGVLVSALCVILSIYAVSWLWFFFLVALVSTLVGPWEGLENSRLLFLASVLTVAAVGGIATLYRFRIVRRMARAFEELQQERQRLIHSTRAKTAGQLASGVAHEVNNPLMVIVGRVHQVEQELARDPIDRSKMKEATERILDSVNRIKRIVNSLRLFSKPLEEEAAAETDINGIVRDVLVLTRTRFTSQEVDLRVALDESNPMTLVRPGQVGQAVIAVLTNAIEAVEGQSPRWVEVVSHATQERVQIRIADSGPGVSKGIRDRLFSSFVGARDSSHSGMGLATAREMVQQNGGKIWLDETSKNTRFVLEFPRLAA